MTSADIRGRDAERWLWRSSQLPTAISRAISRADGRVAFAANAARAQEVAARHRAAWSSSGTARLATIGLPVALAYYVGARLGFLVVFPGSPLSVIWPPNAIVLAALLLVPPRAWWIVLLGVLPAHLVVEWQSGVLPLAVPGLYVTNCGEALLGATLVRRFSGGGPPWLGTLQQVVVYVIGATIAAPFVASFLDTGVVEATHWAASREYWLLWEQRFISAVLTNLTVAPVILVLACGNWRRWRTLPRQRGVEAALLALSLLGSSYVAFSPPTAVPQDTPELVYLLVPVLLWAAVRFGVGGISASLLAIACLAAGWAHAPGLFVARTPAAAVVTLQLLLIALGAPALCLAALVQERDRDAAVLRTSQEQYQAVVETQTELITRYRPDLTLTFVNDATCRFMGRTREELLCIPLDADLDAEDSARVRELVQALVARPELGVLTIEHTAPHRDGTRHWQQWIHRVILDADGRAVELQGIGRDITERKQMEQALQESEARYRAAFESAAIGVAVVDLAGRPLEVNAYFSQMVGYTADELRMLSLRDFTHPDDVAANEALLHRALGGDIGSYQLETRYRHQDGHTVWGRLSASLVRGQDGQPAYFVVHMEDVTQRRQLEREREQAEARELAAQEVAQQLDQFLAMASHDIRTPVTTLSGNLELARMFVTRMAGSLGAHDTHEGRTARQLATVLERADENSTRLSRLVALLFDTTGARLGTLTVTLAPRDLVALVHEQVVALQETVPERTFQVNLPDDAVVVEADADRLGQVLTNYLTNALKYSAADQPVAVRLEVRDGRARVSVQDHGPGLPAEEQQRVWELYYRAPGVAAQRGIGVASGSLGMGLYVCQRLVELHPGGQVGVDSLAGEGCTFWFSLPVTSASSFAQ